MFQSQLIKAIKQNISLIPSLFLRTYNIKGKMAARCIDCLWNGAVNRIKKTITQKMKIRRKKIIIFQIEASLEP